jgi:hypothetical protein
MLSCLLDAIEAMARDVCFIPTEIIRMFAREQDHTGTGLAGD